MNRPYKYSIINRKTNELTETNLTPTLRELQTYEPTDKSNVFELKQTKDCFIDTRYEAKLRLYRYWQRMNGVIELEYSPCAGTEVGKILPILNF